MPDRSDFLARRILAAVEMLDASLGEDGPAPPALLEARRLERIQKILAVDAGTTDTATAKAVFTAMPRPAGAHGVSDREREAFAAFIRRRVAFDLD